MKENTKKILLWLFAAELNNKQSAAGSVSTDIFQKLLPDLTRSGLRSLVRLMEEKQLLVIDDSGTGQRLMLTNYGRERLEAEFLVVKRITEPWTGLWTQILFLNGPSSDPHFRNLRSLLLRNQAFSLKRGVYLYPGKLPYEAAEVIKKEYLNTAAVVELGQWCCCEELIVIGQVLHLHDRIDVYSGISEESAALLRKKQKTKMLTDQQKSKICSIFDRLYQTLENDRGVLQHYFPQAVSGVDLLIDLTSLTAAL